MQYLDFDEVFFFLAGSGKEQKREICLYCIYVLYMWSTLINKSIIFVVLFLDETEVQAWRQNRINWWIKAERPLTIKSKVTPSTPLPKELAKSPSMRQEKYQVNAWKTP